MYHRIVARKVRATFTQISAGNWQPMLTGMAAQFSYTFYGTSALAGERHTIGALRRWQERSSRLLGRPAFEVEEVIVAGAPGATRIATRVRVRATLPDGSAYENIFMQNMRMRWGRITEIHTLEDTAVLQGALDRLAASGVAEAHGEPITDPPASAPRPAH
jgi:ketosteroid isomerase-like protein